MPQNEKERLDDIVRVLEFAHIVDELKCRLRAGWENWSVQADRLESVAEHCFSALILAICLHPLHPDSGRIDINKVLKMLILHEIGETIIGDMTPLDAGYEDKAGIEHQAWRKLLSGMPLENEWYDLLIEFDAHETPESRFAYHIDKLDAEKTLKWYYDSGEMPSLSQCMARNSKIGNNPQVRELVEKGAKTPLDIWYADEYVELRDDPFFMQVLSVIREKDMGKLPL